MVEPYTIKNVENQNLEIGTLQKPHFFHVTSGQTDTKSLLFHAQIKKGYYMYLIRQVNSTFLNLWCKHRNCKAKAYCVIPKILVQK